MRSNRFLRGWCSNVMLSAAGGSWISGMALWCRSRKRLGGSTTSMCLVSGVVCVSMMTGFSAGET